MKSWNGADGCAPSGRWRRSAHYRVVHLSRAWGIAAACIGTASACDGKGKRVKTAGDMKGDAISV